MVREAAPGHGGTLEIAKQMDPENKEWKKNPVTAAM